MTESIPFILAKQFHDCTSNCGSVCDYIADLSDEVFESTIPSLRLFGAVRSAISLEASRSDRLAAQVALRRHTGDGDNLAYLALKQRIDSRSYELKDWSGWHENRH